jgi:hypothetical protein
MENVHRNRIVSMNQLTKHVYFHGSFPEGICGPVSLQMPGAHSLTPWRPKHESILWTFISLDIIFNHSFDNLRHLCFQHEWTCCPLLSGPRGPYGPYLVETFLHSKLLKLSSL